MTRSLLLAVATAVVALALPAAAPAAKPKPLQKAIWGPVEIDGVSQFPIYEDLGVDIYEIQLGWQGTARSRPADPTNPDDPAYRWPESLDRAISEAQQHGMKVLILIQRTPEWANAGEQWYTPPEHPEDFGAFVTAAARRYPTVRHWMIWGEPIRNVAWPDFDRSDYGRRRIAQTYARMLDSAYVALKRESRKNIVIGGNSFTTSTQPEDWAPVPLYEFMKLMRLPDGKVPRMDMWGHNPFTVRKPRLKDGPSDNQGDFSDLDRLMRKLKKRVARPMGRRKNLPIFISEFCLPSGPNPNFPGEWSIARQTSWLRRAFAIARKQRQIYSLGWWRLQDDPNAVGNETASRCGLMDASRNPKPAYRVFQRARTSR